MVPCDAQGNVAVGHIADAGAIEASQQRRKTPFLGNLANGVLYPWTNVLATKDDMISIDSEEQWAQMKMTGEAPPQAPDTIAPALSRANPAPEATDQVKEPEEIATGTMADLDKELLSTDMSNVKAPIGMQQTIPENIGIGLPNIEGLKPREAKTVLSEWATLHFGHKLDRRPPLDDVVIECQRLISITVQSKTG